MKLSPHARTVDALLETKGTSLTEFIETRRAQGLSWDAINRELYDITGGAVAVTSSTVRQWAIDLGLHDPQQVAS